MSTGMKKMGKGSNAANYLLGESQQDISDYYTDDKETIGRVYDPHGLLKVFKINHGEVVNPQHMKNLCAGLHPKTGKPLISVHGEKHTAGFDIAPAPHKSFSALWAVAPPDIRNLLMQIQQKANDTLMNHLQNNAGYTRLGHAGKEQVKAPFFGFQFTHGSSRDQDPHLHIHNPVMNLTYLDGKWRTLETRHFMLWQTSANSIFHSVIADELTKLGVPIKVQEHHVEVALENDALIDFWSKRSNAMKAAAKEEGIELDDLGGMKRVHMSTRQDKRRIDDAHGLWAEEAKKFNFSVKEVMNLFKHVVFHKKEQVNDRRIERANRPDRYGFYAVAGEYDRAHDRSRQFGREFGVQLKPSNNRDALLSFVKKFRGFTNAAENGMRILSGRNVAKAEERAESILSFNVHSDLSRLTGSNTRVRWEGSRNHEARGGKNKKSSINESLKLTSVAQPHYMTEEEITRLCASAIEEIHETEAAFTKNDLIRHVTETLFGETRETVEEAIASIEAGKIKFEKYGVIIPLGERPNNHSSQMPYFTTERFRSIEMGLQAYAKSLCKNGKHNLDMRLIENQLTKIPSLTEEQIEACKHYFSAGSLKVGEGAAGVGKTFAMKPVKLAFESSGYRVFGVAQADSQKDTLGNDLNLPKELRKNIAQLLTEIKNDKLILTSKDVLIIDEGGLIGSENMYDLMMLSKKFDCKIILTGEERQLSSVAAGPGFATVMNAVDKVSRIENIVRQKELWQREMVQKFRQGHAIEGLNTLNEHNGLFFSSNNKSMMKGLIENWNTDRLLNPNASRLILSLRNTDTRELNLLARECLKRSGEITGQDVKVLCDINHKKDSQFSLPFAPGDHIILTKKDAEIGITNGTRSVIQSIRPNTETTGYIFELKTSDGKFVSIDTSQYKDKTSNAVAIKHGYALSKWPSQGLTIDKTYVTGGEDDLRYAYVGLSRFKSHVELHVPSNKLKDKIKEYRESRDLELSIDITENDLIKELAKGMSKKSHKLSTLEFPAVIQFIEQIKSEVKNNAIQKMSKLTEDIKQSINETLSALTPQKIANIKLHLAPQISQKQTIK